MADTTTQTAQEKQQDENLMLVQQMLAESSNKIAGYTDQLVAAGADSAKLTQTQKESVDRAASAAQVIAAQNANAQMWAEDIAAQISDAAGGSIAQVAQMARFKALGDELQREQDLRTKELNQEHTGIGFIDQAINKYQTKDNDIRIQDLTTKLDTTAALAQNSTAMQEGFAKQNQLAKRTVTTETMQANNEIIQANATKEKAILDRQDIADQATNTRALLAADQQDISNRLQAVNVGIRSEEIKNTRERIKEDRATRKLREPLVRAQIEQAQMQIEDYKANRGVVTKAQYLQAQKTIDSYNADVQVNQEISTSVQTAQQSLGLPVESPEIIEAKYKNPATRDKYIKLDEMGMVPGKVIFGESPYDAAMNLSTVDPTGNADVSQALAAHDTVNTMIEGIIAADPKQTPRTAEQAKALYNGAARQLFMSAANNIPFGDATNPYQAPPFTIIADSKAVRQSPLYKNVLAQYDITETNPQRLLELAASGVKAKAITPEEAAQGIQTIFQVAAEYNNTAQGGYERAGFGDYEQKSYNTTIKIKPGFGSYFSAFGGAVVKGGTNPLSSAYFTKKASEDINRNKQVKVNLMNYSDTLLTVTKMLSGEVEDLPTPTNTDNSK